MSKWVVQRRFTTQTSRRKRSRSSPTPSEREAISRGVVTGYSLRSIAASPGRAPSTISRETNRNGGCRDYRASAADLATWNRAMEMADYKRCIKTTAGVAVIPVSGKLLIMKPWARNRENAACPQALFRIHLYSRCFHPDSYQSCRASL